MSTKLNNGTVQKEQERNELHRAIWQIANDLRGSVDGWDFKQYVLGMLFYRFISENLTSYINKDEWRTGNKDFIPNYQIWKPNMAAPILSKRRAFTFSRANCS